MVPLPAWTSRWTTRRWQFSRLAVMSFLSGDPQPSSSSASCPVAIHRQGPSTRLKRWWWCWPTMVCWASSQTRARRLSAGERQACWSSQKNQSRKRKLLRRSLKGVSALMQEQAPFFTGWKASFCVLRKREYPVRYQYRLRSVGICHRAWVRMVVDRLSHPEWRYYGKRNQQTEFLKHEQRERQDG